MEEDILNYSPKLSCFVGHPVYKNKIFETKHSDRSTLRV